MKLMITFRYSLARLSANQIRISLFIAFDFADMPTRLENAIDQLCTRRQWIKVLTFTPTCLHHLIIYFALQRARYLFWVSTLSLKLNCGHTWVTGLRTIFSTLLLMATWVNSHTWLYADYILTIIPNFMPIWKIFFALYLT